MRIQQFWMISIGIIVVLACSLYHIKYKVVDLERAYFSLQHKEKSLIDLNHTLQAEYSLLASPKRLVDLMNRHLGEGYANPAYHQHVSDIKLVSALKPLTIAQEDPVLLGDDGWETSSVQHQ